MATTPIPIYLVDPVSGYAVVASAGVFVIVGYQPAFIEICVANERIAMPTVTAELIE